MLQKGYKSKIENFLSMFNKDFIFQTNNKKKNYLDTPPFFTLYLKITSTRTRNPILVKRQ